MNHTTIRIKKDLLPELKLFQAMLKERSMGALIKRLLNEYPRDWKVEDFKAALMYGHQSYNYWRAELVLKKVNEYIGFLEDKKSRAEPDAIPIIDKELLKYYELREVCQRAVKRRAKYAREEAS
jgi:hypothetical protein